MREPCCGIRWRERGNRPQQARWPITGSLQAGQLGDYVPGLAIGRLGSSKTLCGKPEQKSATARVHKRPTISIEWNGGALSVTWVHLSHVLSDRATWLHFGHKQDLEIVVEGDRRPFKEYGVMLVNPQKHPNVKRDLGQQFIDYLISPDGQQAMQTSPERA